MLKLYNVNKEKIEGLTKYKDLVRERDLKKGEDTLSFSYPKKLSKNIKEECYIETKFNFYVIKEIDNSSGDWIGVIAKVNIEGLKSNSFPHFEMVNSYLKDTLNLALAGTSWTIGHNDITKRRTVRVSNSTPLEIIDEIRKAYRAEIFYDAINKKVNVYEKLGDDKGDFFMEDVNLKSLNISSDSYDYVTRLIPLGKDGLTIEEINNGKKYVENYQYSNKIIYATWEDNRYTVVENLKEDAISKLEELSKPYKSYEADVVDLRGANLGDTITLISKENGVKEKQRVVKITEYPDEPWNNKVEIANKTYTFEEMQSEVIDTVETADTVLTSDGMVDESKIDFNPIRQEFVTIIAEKADIVDLNAALIRVGELEATKANITDLDAINARIDNLDVEDLEAINADITFLKVKVGEIDHLLAGNITAENIAVGAITAGSGIIADGAIGDAQINAVTAGKIKSGTLDTSLVTVAGTDGKLNITGNRLQVIHEGLERVALGDVNRDGSAYGLRVRGEDGETVLFDERGLTREGLTDGAIDDSKVDDAANIQGHKLDINSVAREFNENGTETIKGTRVQVGDRTLDVELSTQKIAIDENKEEISNQRSEIKALDDAIKFKVDNQEFSQYKTTNDNNITTINTQLSKNTSSINVLQEEINLKVSQTDAEKLISDIEIGGRNLFSPNDTAKERMDFEEVKSSPYSMWIGDRFVLFSDRIKIDDNEKFTVSFWYKLKQGEISNDGDLHLIYYDKYGNRITAHNSKFCLETEWDYFKETYNMLEGAQYLTINFIVRTTSGEGWINGLKLEKGTKATDWTPAPEDIENEITAINTKVADININLDSITSRVSSTESKIIKVNDEVSTIESRVSIAEQKITDDSIINTVRNSTAYKNDLDGKANESDLKVAESIIEQHTDQISERVTIDGIGTEIIKNANSVRLAVGKIGAINLIQFSNIDGRGKIIKDKYVYDGTVILETKALYEGISIKIPQIKPNTEYTLSFKYKKLDGSLKAFGGHTDNTYSNNIANVDGQGDKPLSDSSSIFIADDTEVHEVVVKFKTGNTVSSNDLFYLQPNRSQDGIYVKVEITELQFEEGDYVTAWKPYPGEGEGPGYLLTGDTATFKNTSLKIINENNYPVFEGTTDGMLKIMAQITTGYQIGYNLSIIGNSITFEYAKANEGRHQVGAIAAGLNPFGANSELEEGISITHNYGRHIALGGWSNTGVPHHYLILDRENRLGFLPQFPAIFLSNVGFYYRTRHFGTVEIMNNIYFKTGNSSEPNINGYNDWLNLNAYNFSLNGQSGTNPRFQYQASSGKSVFFTNTHVNKDFTVSGKKNALHKTKNYGDRLINSYEMAEYYSGDLGSGKLDRNGECYIFIDDIFGETINTDVQYHVFLQKLGQGDLWIEERNALYFVVKGTPNLRFSWELKAKRDGYEYDRLEELATDIHDENDTRLEEIINEETTFDLVDYVLGGEEFENIN
jgi:phage minor structural protein